MSAQPHSGHSEGISKAGSPGMAKRPHSERSIAGSQQVAPRVKRPLLHPLGERVTHRPVQQGGPVELIGQS